MRRTAKFSEMSIRSILRFSFGLMVAVSLLVGTVSVISMVYIDSRYSETIEDYIAPVTAISEAIDNLLQAKALMKAYSPQDMTAEKLKQEIDALQTGYLLAVTRYEEAILLSAQGSVLDSSLRKYETELRQLYELAVVCLNKGDEDGFADAVRQFSVTADTVRDLLASSMKAEVWYANKSNEQVARVSRLLLVVVPAISFIGVIVSFIYSQRVIRLLTGPINQLSEAFNRASRTKEYITCEVTGLRDVEHLADDYNTMIGQLNLQHENLQDAYERISSGEESLRLQFNILSEVQRQTEYLAYHDTLTGLYNRLQFERALDVYLCDWKPGAVLYVDLDNFKNINDYYDHAFGDKLLCQIAERILSDKKRYTLVSRFSGDEFCFFVLGGRPEAQTLADYLLEILSRPIAVDGIQVHVTASIGISLFPDHGSEKSELLKNADSALFGAKDNGRNTSCFFNEAMGAEIIRHNNVREALRFCREKNELYMNYQPEFELATGKLIGFEALVRLKTEALGDVGPSEFIPIAESSGMITRLGGWVLNDVCRFAKELVDMGFLDVVLAVNLSYGQIAEAGFCRRVRETLAAHALSPQHIQLEVTESILMKHFEEGAAVLSELRAEGLVIALDDFGTGYSSMNYLVQLPLDILKIDKSFIDPILWDKRAQIVCESIINLAHSLSLTVVAEGVEQSAQQEWLLARGCDRVQGYLTGLPASPSDVIQLLTINKKQLGNDIHD